MNIIWKCIASANTLVRLPMFYDLDIEQAENICKLIQEYCAL